MREWCSGVRWISTSEARKTDFALAHHQFGRFVRRQQRRVPGLVGRFGCHWRCQLGCCQWLVGRRGPLVVPRLARPGRRRCRHCRRCRRSPLSGEYFHPRTGPPHALYMPSPRCVVFSRGVAFALFPFRPREGNNKQFLSISPTSALLLGWNSLAFGVCRETVFGACGSTGRPELNRWFILFPRANPQAEVFQRLPRHHLLKRLLEIFGVAHPETPTSSACEGPDSRLCPLSDLRVFWSLQRCRLSRGRKRSVRMEEGPLSRCGRRSDSLPGAVQCSRCGNRGGPDAGSQRPSLSRCISHAML